jgi:tetratricopeptide (TPR) repeat protein
MLIGQAQAQTAPAKFDEEISRLAHADSDAAILKIAEEALAKCATADDFERFAASVKTMADEKSSFKYMAALDYVMAKVKIDEIAFLSQKNDIESGRLYMSLNERYRSEAIDYLDKALTSAKSKDLMLDIYFLKFLATKEEFQAQKTDAFIDELANKIAKYSNDNSLNKRQLTRMADEFALKGLGDYALKLRIAYARKVDPKLAQEVFEDIKKAADKNFGQGNMKAASNIYDVYMSEAGAYFNKEAMAAKVMEIAEKYFGANKYRDARKYYEYYAQNYPDSKVMDYCKYRMALCYYYEKDYQKAVASLEEFLSTYQNSVWFDRAFETLCRLYFCNFPKETAVAGLQKLIDNYYRKNIGDFAYLLIGLEYYADKEYDKALDILKKVDINSVYSYASDMIITDIKDIKNGSAPTYTFGAKDKYRMWEPFKPVTIDIVPMQAGDAGEWMKGAGKGEDKKLEVTYTQSGAAQVSVAPGAKIKFALATLADEDRFAEYLQDKEDLSRLPKKVKEESEKDFVSLQWTSEGGKFVDERQTRDKVWQAPTEPGSYKVSISSDDFGLTREPDKGIRKDPAKEMSIIINVKAE